VSVEGWRESYLNEITTKITKGTTPTTIGCSFVSKGINFIKSECIASERLLDKSKYVYIDVLTHEKLKRSQIEVNDILFSMAGMFLGKTAIVNETDVPANTNQAVAIIRVDEQKAHYAFVYYYLNQYHIKEHINNSTSQSAQPNINLKQIGEISLVLPNLSEQKAIAATLSVLDDTVELNNQINKKLEEMAQAIFKSWFVDFEPFKDGEFEESELGLIPRGWRVDSIGNCTSIVTRGIAPKYADFSDRHVINQKCIRDGSLNTSLARPHCSVVKEEKKLLFGDVLINSTGVGTLGRVAQVYEHLENYTVDSHVTIVRLNMSNGIGYFGCMLKNMQPKFEHAATGSTGQTELGREAIKQMRILIPDNKTIDDFSKIYNSLSNKIVYYNKENKVLSNIRYTLLPKLMSSEIRVPVEEGERVV
jgi:type I restriction enzyme S subunit